MNNTMTEKHTLVRSILVSLALCLCSVASADILINPTRVMMNDANPSDGSRTDRLSCQDKRANSDGRYSFIQEGGKWSSAKGMIRHSPRQITVGHNDNQTMCFIVKASNAT